MFKSLHSSSVQIRSVSIKVSCLVLCGAMGEKRAKTFNYSTYRDQRPWPYVVASRDAMLYVRYVEYYVPKSALAVAQRGHDSKIT